MATSNLERQVVAVMRRVRQRGRVEAKALARQLEKTADSLESVRLAGPHPELSRGRRRTD